METEVFSTTAKEIYKQALLYVIEREREVQATGRITVGRLFDIAGEIVRSIEKSEQLNSYAVYYFDPADITRSHVINTAIFTTVLARGIGYSGDELTGICATALLHDIGVAKLDSAIFNKPVALLNPEELNSIEKHSGFGYEIITRSDDKLEEFAQPVYQHHEKGDGSGYPKQLLEKDMNRNAKIISLIDTYEALVHPRDHRDALVPPVGIQELVRQEGKRFSRPLMKALIETISLYPTGCYVKLNSGEIAKVIKTNKHIPTRPQVKILFDASRQRAKQQILDLAMNNLAFIETCIPPPGMRKIE